jgi:hypothetical protein
MTECRTWSFADKRLGEGAEALVAAAEATAAPTEGTVEVAGSAVTLISTSPWSRQSTARTLPASGGREHGIAREAQSIRRV